MHNDYSACMYCDHTACIMFYGLMFGGRESGGRSPPLEVFVRPLGSPIFAWLPATLSEDLRMFEGIRSGGRSPPVEVDGFVRPLD